MIQTKLRPTLTPYLRIKQHLKTELAHGRWQPGMLMPSESALVAQFGVSRMTVNRAMRELQTKGLIERVQGVGTFAAQLHRLSSTLSIRDMQEEIKARGHSYRLHVHYVREETASSVVAKKLALVEGAPVYHSLVVHFDDDVPLQSEDRFVNPASAPEYLSVDFSRITPTQYLIETAPTWEAAYTIDASAPTQEEAHLLKTDIAAPCLIITRWTISRGSLPHWSDSYIPGYATSSKGASADESQTFSITLAICILEFPHKLPRYPSLRYLKGRYHMDSLMLTLYRNAHLVTLTSQSGWGLIKRGAFITHGETLQWVGSEDGLQKHLDVSAEYDLGGALVTPGLIDCHTHLVYGGNRAQEFETLLLGASYEQIARQGGGILSTVSATRAADEATLHASALGRAQQLISNGVTTLEIKSGYGLSLKDESRCLRVARNLACDLPISVRTTCLAAHTVPPEYENRPDAYIDAVCDWLPQLQKLGLIDAVDAFCDDIAFNVEQTRRVFEVARHLGVPVKLHAEQLSQQGGAQLAAEFGALSCDHLEHLDSTGINAMAKSGTTAVLLPSAFYYIRETKVPPIEALRAANIPIALATDHNPGSSPCLSPLLILNLSCTLFRLTPEEALRGMTVNGARALGLRDRGQLACGQRADFVVWPLDHPNELAYWLGQHPHVHIFCGGTEIHV